MLKFVSAIKVQFSKKKWGKFFSGKRPNQGGVRGVCGKRPDFFWIFFLRPTGVVPRQKHSGFDHFQFRQSRSHPLYLHKPAGSWDESGGDLLLLEAPQHGQICDVFTLNNTIGNFIQVLQFSLWMGVPGTCSVQNMAALAHTALEFRKLYLVHNINMGEFCHHHHHSVLHQSIVDVSD